MRNTFSRINLDCFYLRVSQLYITFYKKKVLAKFRLILYRDVKVKVSAQIYKKYPAVVQKRFVVHNNMKQNMYVQ